MEDRNELLELYRHLAGATAALAKRLGIKPKPKKVRCPHCGQMHEVSE